MTSYLLPLCVSDIQASFRTSSQVQRKRWDFKRHDNLLRVPHITVLEGRECTACSQQPPLASCSLLQRNTHLTPQSCWKHTKSIRAGVQTRRGSAQCKHSKGVQHQELDLEAISRHHCANSRSSNEDMVKKEESASTQMPFAAGTNPQVTVQVKFRAAPSQSCHSKR